MIFWNSLQIRRFYFAVNSFGEISSSLDKSSKQNVTPRRPGSALTFQRAQSSTDVYKIPPQAEPSFLSEMRSRGITTPLIIPMEPQDLFRRTQSSNDVAKANASIPLPAIVPVPESPSKYTRGRQNRTVMDSAPAELLFAPSPAPPVDSKICYYSVSKAA